MTRIYPPLSADHPCVTKSIPCWICDRPFQAGQRTILVPIEAHDGPGFKNVEAKVVHATCRLRGREAIYWDGDKPLTLIVERVKDGDGSPYAIETTDGRQWREDEVELPALSE